MTSDLGFLFIFTLATAVAIAARYFRVPYTVALVVAGLGLGFVDSIEPPHLTKDLLFIIILPGLLFEAAYHVEFRKFWRNKLAIHALAIPGVVAAIGATAFFLSPFLRDVEGFLFIHALVFASVIVSTDPIAVVGLFKSLGAPKRLAILVEGESLLNDGTAVVLFTLIVAVALGQPFDATSAAFDFVRVVGMGMLIGGGIGWAVTKVIANIDDAMVEITLTVIAGYGSFVVAEHFHYSGVIATVVAGMLCGNLAARHEMSPTTRVAVASFWEYLAFALNSVVFLLIGTEVKIASLLSDWKPILVAYLAVLGGRAVVVFAVSGALKLTAERMPWSWSKVLTWAGLRGAISMVLVLSLPADFAHRQLLINMTFGVVVLSIIVQGLSMAPLLRRLGITGNKDEYQERYEQVRGRLSAVYAALAALGEMRRAREIPGDVIDQLERDYQARAGEAEQEIAKLRAQTSRFQEEEHQQALRRAIIVEKDALNEALQKGAIGAEAFEHLVAEVNARLDALDAHDEQLQPATPPPPAPAGEPA